ncbi:Hypothetical protein ETEE_2774 [Edwardsiella anguillarum ET080813]|uniref:Uncharacterized protein n=1 Tax=Edwardsiella anguillarum ET080813 TaxID=667120 RepID=A0A076LR95_9GAMM|nr:Hypothetical protein ETEE_2774 [Edwardsiella anguillarum ET080813]
MLSVPSVHPSGAALSAPLAARQAAPCYLDKRTLSVGKSTQNT